MSERFTNSSPGALTMRQAIERAKEISAKHRRQVRQARELAAQGRGGDTEVAHVTRGEMVVPRQLQNPEVLAALGRAAAEYNVPLEMLSIGNTMNRINPSTGMPEFWFDDWRNKISNFFGGEDAQAATEGAASRAAYSGIANDLVRGNYDERAVKLDPFDNAGRETLKKEFRAQMPKELQVFVQDKPYGPGDGSFGHANVTNPVATENARILGRIGRGAGILGAGLAVTDIATSDNPYRAASANAGALVGGFLGGAGGAAIGAPSVVGAPVGALGGSIVGGDVGYRVGEKLYDFGANQFARWRR